MNVFLENETRLFEIPTYGNGEGRHIEQSVGSLCV